jgi:hypothetical protein
MADEIKTTKGVNLYVYIVNYNKKNEISKHSEEIFKTEIYTYEHTFTILEDPSLDLIRTTTIKDPNTIIPDKLKDINPHIIGENEDFDDFIMSQMDFYFANGKIQDRSISINYMFASEDYKNYELRSCILKFIECGYNKIKLNLNRKTLNLDPLQYNLDTFILEDSNLIINDATIMNATNFSLNNIKIIARCDKEDQGVFASFNLTSNNASIKNIEIIKDNFVHLYISSKNDNEILWRKSKIYINNLTYNYTKDNKIKHLVNTFIRCGFCYEVDLIAIKIKTEECGMNLIKINDCTHVKVSNFQYSSTFNIKRDLIVMDACVNTKVIKARVSMTERYNKDIPSSPKVYLVKLIKTVQLSKHKFVDISLDSCGLLSGVGITSKELICSKIRINNSYKVFNFDQNSSLNTFKLMDSDFKNVEYMNIDGSDIYISNTELPVEYLYFNIREKMFLSDPYFKCKEEIKFTLLGGADSKFMIDKGALISKKIIIEGDMGFGLVRTKKSRLEASDEFRATGLESLALTTGVIKTRNLILQAEKIRELSCQIKSSMIDKVELTGTCQTTEIRLSGDDHRKVRVNLENCFGDVFISNFSYRNIELDLHATKVNVYCIVPYGFKGDTKNTDVLLTVDDKSKGSTVMGTNPFFNVKLLDSIGFNDCKKITVLSEYKDVKNKIYVLYGNNVLGLI